MRWRCIKMVVQLLYIFSMISLRPGEPEETFFENGIFAVPKGQGKAEILIAVADSGQTVFIPSIGGGAGVFVGEVVPGVAVDAVVLPHGSPGSFGKVWAPMFPVALLLLVVFQSLLLGCWRRFLHYLTFRQIFMSFSTSLERRPVRLG